MIGQFKSPFLKRVRLTDGTVAKKGFPFGLPVFKHGLDIELSTPVTFIVGANGSGKSTLMEAIADKCEFNLAGGNRNHSYERNDTTSKLSESLTLSWLPKVTTGFFMRAETYFNFGAYVDGLELPPRDLRWEDDRESFHDQSHGQSFLMLFKNRFKQGIYLLDEPESALSPASQLAFLALINKLERAGKAQFIIATHSPILICYPGAAILSLSDDGINKIDYHEAEQYRLTKSFLESPERYFRHLFQS